ncbi:putative RING-H2 finger protein ATL71 [Quercus lobata]|uniref:putative RING-H2 finger protein ATL71 n=1 Tax=Quercus lobata TaxID=97700 RepID=UPI00124880A8|nr:putative RING-H2 finger protein ATL71 [Quercus lobata]
MSSKNLYGLPSLQNGNLTTAEQNAITIELGLDEATLDKYPKLIYAQAKLHKDKANSTTSCCSICLADYKDTDVLRDLPDCGHLFHLECVDSWLKLHATCPNGVDLEKLTNAEDPFGEELQRRTVGMECGGSEGTMAAPPFTAADI